MKKLISLFAAISMLSLSAAAVQAADTTLENYVPTDDKYSIDYNVGTENAGAYYGMVAVSGEGSEIDTTNVDNYVYIDQATASSEGEIVFSGFAPKGLAPSAEGYTVSTVFIGGQGLETAKAIGVLRAAGYTEDTATTFVISGKAIDTVSSIKLANITVKDKDGNILNEGGVATKADEAGVYAITVPAGAEYSVVITKDGYLTFTYTNVTVDKDITLADATISNLAGDVDTSGQIVAGDLLTVIGDFGKTTGMTNSNSDIDSSGQVVAGDLLTVIGNFGNVGVTQAAAYVTAE